MRRNPVTAFAVVAGLLLIVAGVASSAVTNVYWRVDLNQGTSIIAYGQGATEQAAWEDCYRLQAITRAMTAVETRKIAVSAVTTSAVRWCKNPMRFATVSPDPTGQATLTWTHEPNFSVEGFRIVHGTDPNALTSTVQIDNAAVRTHTITGLPPGTRYFALRAFGGGVESELSNVLSKTIQ